MGVCASSRAKECPIAVDNEIIDDSDETWRGVNDDSERQEEVQPELEHDTDKDRRGVDDSERQEEVQPELEHETDKDRRGVDDNERQEEVQSELEHETDQKAIKVNDTETTATHTMLICCIVSIVI